MKRFLMMVVLMASVAQANGPEKFWNSFGKDSRVISAGKPLVTGYLTYVTARAVVERVLLAGNVYETKKADLYALGDVWYVEPKAERISRYLALAAFLGCAAYRFFEQTKYDVKQVFSKKDTA